MNEKIESLIGLYTPTTWIIGLGVLIALVALWSLKPTSRLWPNIIGSLLAAGAIVIFFAITFSGDYNGVGTGVGVILLAIASLIAYSDHSKGLTT